MTGHCIISDGGDYASGESVGETLRSATGHAPHLTHSPLSSRTFLTAHHAAAPYSQPTTQPPLTHSPPRSRTLLTAHHAAARADCPIGRKPLVHMRIERLSRQATREAIRWPCRQCATRLCNGVVQRCRPVGVGGFRLTAATVPRAITGKGHDKLRSALRGACALISSVACHAINSVRPCCVLACNQSNSLQR